MKRKDGPTLAVGELWAFLKWANFINSLVQLWCLLGLQIQRPPTPPECDKVDDLPLSSLGTDSRNIKIFLQLCHDVRHQKSYTAVFSFFNRISRGFAFIVPLGPLVHWTTYLSGSKTGQAETGSRYHVLFFSKSSTMNGDLLWNAKNVFFVCVSF